MGHRRRRQAVRISRRATSERRTFHREPCRYHTSGMGTLEGTHSRGVRPHHYNNGAEDSKRGQSTQRSSGENHRRRRGSRDIRAGGLQAEWRGGRTSTMDIREQQTIGRCLTMHGTRRLCHNGTCLRAHKKGRSTLSTWGTLQSMPMGSKRRKGSRKMLRELQRRRKSPRKPSFELGMAQGTGKGGPRSHTSPDFRNDSGDGHPFRANSGGQWTHCRTPLTVEYDNEQVLVKAGHSGEVLFTETFDQDLQLWTMDIASLMTSQGTQQEGRCCTIRREEWYAAADMGHDFRPVRRKRFEAHQVTGRSGKESHGPTSEEENGVLVAIQLLSPLVYRRDDLEDSAYVMFTKQAAETCLRHLTYTLFRSSVLADVTSAVVEFYK